MAHGLVIDGIGFSIVKMCWRQSRAGGTPALHRGAIFAGVGRMRQHPGAVMTRHRFAHVPPDTMARGGSRADGFSIFERDSFNPRGPKRRRAGALYNLARFCEVAFKRRVVGC